MTVAIIMAVMIVPAQASTTPTDVYQFEDMFWKVENDYAVVIGNIYDNDMIPAEDAGTTRMVVPAKIDGFPVKVFDGHFDMWSPQEVVLPEGLTTIRADAFNDAPIIQISIPSTVTSIEPGAIVFCDELEEIHVEPGNANYAAVDGILYTKDGKELLCCPPQIETDNGTLAIPAGTEKVQSLAFTNCYGIKKLIFPEGLTALENSAISENSFAEAVYFPSTLEYMGEFSFSATYCPDIYFAGDSFTFESRTFEGSRNTTVHLGEGVTMPIADFVRSDKTETARPEPLAPDERESGDGTESVLPELELQNENGERTGADAERDGTAQPRPLWAVWSLILVFAAGALAAVMCLRKK